jgi:hypothetical protein
MERKVEAHRSILYYKPTIWLSQTKKGVVYISLANDYFIQFNMAEVVKQPPDTMGD